MRPSKVHNADERRLTRCRTLIRQRRALAKLLKGKPTDSPFVDMVLDLYVAELEMRDLCQSSIESRASRASAHRHAHSLVQSGMAVHDVDPADLRRKTVRLARHVRVSLDAFLDGLPNI